MSTPSLPKQIDAAFRTLVGAIARSEPLPAGGAAGVVAIAMGIGLGLKVVGLSQASKPELIPVGEELRTILDRLLPEFAADCDAFAGLLAALRLPREDAAREPSVQAAWRGATALPVAVAMAAGAAQALLLRCAGKVKPSMACDLVAALELVRSGRRIAVNNARENAFRLPEAEARKLLAPLVDHVD